MKFLRQEANYIRDTVADQAVARRPPEFVKKDDHAHRMNTALVINVKNVIDACPNLTDQVKKDLL